MVYVKKKLIIGFTVLIFCFFNCVIYFKIGIIKITEDTFLILNDNKIAKVLSNINNQEADKYMYWLNIKGRIGHIRKYELLDKSQVTVDSRTNSNVIVVIPTKNVVIQGTTPKSSTGFLESLMQSLFQDSINIISSWEIAGIQKEGAVKLKHETCFQVNDSLYVQAFYLKILSSKEHISFYRYTNKNSKEKLETNVNISIE
jgi:hypothetical protein